MNEAGSPTRYGDLRGRGGSLRPLVDRRRSEAPRCSLSTGDRTHLWNAIGTAVDAGLAVLLARTGDGGAVSLTLYEGDDRSRTYCSNDEELEAASAAILDASQATLIGRAGAQPAKRR